MTLNGIALTVTLTSEAQLLAAHLAGENIYALAVFHDRGAVDYNGLHTRWMALHFLCIDHRRQLLADQIVDFIGVEHGYIGGHAFFQHATVEAELLRREAG